MCFLKIRLLYILFISRSQNNLYFLLCVGRLKDTNAKKSGHLVLLIINVQLLFQTQQVREVYHFHYTTWPDFGIPSSPVSFLMFLQAVRDKGVLDEENGPAVIHCSAGIGRSGTFCLVDSALVLVSSPLI